MLKTAVSCAAIVAGFFLMPSHALSEVVAIQNTDYETRHQELIVQAIEKKCGAVNEIRVLEAQLEEIRIDQGVVDRRFITKLEFKQQLQPNVQDTYTVTVGSFAADLYDHQSGYWGHYSLESISSCDLQERYWFN